MALKRFKTKIWLWLSLSLCLFVPPWFIGPIGSSGAEITAAGYWVLLFTHPSNFGAVLDGIFICTIFFAIPALAIGWVVHCLIVIAVDLVRGRRANT